MTPNKKSIIQHLGSKIKNPGSRIQHLGSKLLLTFSFLILAFNFAVATATASPSISGITAPSSVAKYDKFEIDFQITNTTATNLQFPYDPNTPNGVDSGIGISVDALFLPPGQSDWNQAHLKPAFLYQHFDQDFRQNRDWLYPHDQYSWKVRFAPNSTGNWQFRLRATDSSGTSLSDPASFTVTDSDNKGFIRVSPHDSRYFQYEDGTYFPALGYNLRLNTSNVGANENHFQTMGQNGIRLGRTWLSSWSIFGSSWNPWNAMPQDYDGYLPREGLEAFDDDFRLKLVYRASNPNQPQCEDNCSYWKATRFLGWMTPSPAVKPSTNYRIRIRYQAQNLAGPRHPDHPNYGLVAKVGDWLGQAHNPGTGDIVSEYGGNTDSWSEITGTWNSGNRNYLPNFYLTLENVIDPGIGNPGPTAFIDKVWIQEDYGNGQFGPNILNKPSMQHHKYFDQRQSKAFDQIIDLAEKHDVYLRLVILEKEEYILNHIDFEGNLRTDDPPNLFYGDGRDLNATRWYQQAWWRYLQARWGYSTHIHSWELVNEGNPFLANHYILTDEMGKFMRCTVFGINSGTDCNHNHPNWHLSSTSNWHSFPSSSWQAQPNIDFADVHQYISQDNQPDQFNDLAHATINRGANVTGYTRGPVIRGETGLISAANNTDGFTHLIPCTRHLHQGTWLRNLLWAGLNHYGLIESYWYNPEHIYPNQNFSCSGGTQHISYDERPIYRHFYDFAHNLPFPQGGYQDLNPQSVPSALRVVGQKHEDGHHAHFWIQNRQHTWTNLADQATIQPVTGNFIIGGLSPNTTLPYERWNTQTGTIAQTGTFNTNSQGELTINVTSLTSDTAYKIGDYDDITPPNTPTPIPTPSTTYSHLIQNFGTNDTDADLNNDGIVNIFDLNLWITQN